jgi:acylphosphatase
MSGQCRAHVIVSGRVQGVFFRAFTEDIARSLKLGGWVRNTPDGRVEAVFEGRREDIENALQSCRQGPPGARVEDVQVDWQEPRGESGSFSVRFF